MVNIGTYLSLYIRTFFSHGSMRSIALKKIIITQLMPCIGMFTIQYLFVIKRCV